MIWNGKRYVGLQLYKKRGENDYLLVYLYDSHISPEGLIYMSLGELFTEPRENEVTPAHGQVSGKILREYYYPISQRQMKEIKGSEKCEKVLNREFQDIDCLEDTLSKEERTNHE